MAQFEFTLGLYALSDFNSAAQTNSTTGYPRNTRVRLDPGAEPITIRIADDDGNTANTFDDGYIDQPGPGGGNPSTANNDQVLVRDVTIDGVTYSAGSQVELEFSFDTQRGETLWMIRIDGQNVGISGEQLPVPGRNYRTRDINDASTVPVSEVPCFGDGARVATPTGERPIETLSVGDLVETVDEGPMPIRWIGKRTLAAREIGLKPELRPILVRRNAFGAGRPQRDLVLSRQHRVLVERSRLSLYFGESTMLCAAHRLVDGVRVVPAPIPETLTYWHLLLDRHAILRVNGLPAESLYPDTRQLPPAAREELALLGFRPRAERAALARPTLAGREAALAYRDS